MSIIFNEGWPEARTDKVLTKLIADNPQIDPAYITMATGYMLKKRRELMEQGWAGFEPYADKGFVESIKRQGEFFGHAWEMQVGVALLQQGNALAKRNAGKGPDIKLQTSPTVWIEAVSCTSGVGPDAVPGVIHGTSFGIPTEEMLLRLGNAVMTKFRKYEGYLKDGIVKTGEPFVIAVSKGAIDHPGSHPPLELRYLYGVGDQVLRFPVDATTGKRTDTDEEPTSGFTRQPPIPKKAGESVPVAFFEDPAHAGISAIIWCSNNALNHPEPAGADFVLLRNPNATTPLPDDFLTQGAEWVVKGDNLTYEEKNFIAHADAFDYLED